MSRIKPTAVPEAGRAPRPGPRLRLAMLAIALARSSSCSRSGSRRRPSASASTGSAGPGRWSSSSSRGPHLRDVPRADPGRRGGAAVRHRARDAGGARVGDARREPRVRHRPLRRGRRGRGARRPADQGARDLGRRARVHLRALRADRAGDALQRRQLRLRPDDDPASASSPRRRRSARRRERSPTSRSAARSATSPRPPRSSPS